MKYVQIHELMSFPASNVNRDDLNRPKTVTIGEGTRLRISSQSLKRAWRTSDIMNGAFPEMGIRTKELSKHIENALVRGLTLQDEIAGRTEATRTSVDKKTAKKYAELIDGEFRKKKSSEKDDGEEEEQAEKKEKKETKGKKSDKKQLLHYSPAELARADEAMAAVAEGKEPKLDGLYAREPFPADIAMFGRFVANNTAQSCEAAVQVAHAYTVHKAVIEDDFFTAVDDLSSRDEAGAGHMDESSFGAGLFYIYICVDFELLAANMGSEEDAMKALRCLIEAASTVTPTGKQNSFASRSYASYILVETGDRQPRSLSPAFLKPVRGDDLLGNAVEALRTTERNIDASYGKCYDRSYEIYAQEGTGSIDGLMKILG